MTEPFFKAEDFNPARINTIMLGDAARLANAIHEERCPYKARPENSEGNEYAQVCAMKDENARLREALEKIAKQNTIDEAENLEDFDGNLEAAWGIVISIARAAMEGK